jgi:hypothetical protein
MAVAQDQMVGILGVFLNFREIAAHGIDVAIVGL